LNPPATDTPHARDETPGDGELQIRRWVFADIATIQRITLEAWLDAYRSFIPEADLREYLATHFSATVLERVMASPDVHGYVAEDRSGPLGWMRTLWDPTTRRCSMTSLYVLPHRQHRGVGGRLLDVAERCARSYGVRELWLGVLEQNLPALEWYERHGFVVTHRAPFTMGATTLNHCVCVKQLGVKGPGHGS
jgi:ribosomal protein S18 acetylase RimI-like enzyme